MSAIIMLRDVAAQRLFVPRFQAARKVEGAGVEATFLSRKKSK